MKLGLRKHTHIRFEPEVDGGTTYAFEHKKGLLVIGRKKMHSVLSALLEKDRELDFLRKTFIVASSDEGAYFDEKELMIDLMKLINADVIQTISPGSDPDSET
ncbi:MAG TPA: hypothetical protein VHO84_00825 [Syntrophorhabdaceae bacterium]|jgi:hypothetical protein|nr:hypothetical protein [Syntrophorhabdaceae bacterium]